LYKFPPLTHKIPLDNYLWQNARPAATRRGRGGCIRAQPSFSSPSRGSAGGGGAQCSLVDLVLEDVEVVGGRHGDDVLVRVPRGVKDLLAEVQAVHADLVLAALPTDTHLAGRDTEDVSLNAKVHKDFSDFLTTIYIFLPTRGHQNA